jgi:hypothetical protein
MADERDFLFNFNIFTVGSRESFVRSCRVAERHGYDVAFAADHPRRLRPVVERLRAEQSSRYAPSPR